MQLAFLSLKHGSSMKLLYKIKAHYNKKYICIAYKHPHTQKYTNIVKFFIRQNDDKIRFFSCGEADWVKKFLSVKLSSNNPDGADRPFGLK